MPWTMEQKIFCVEKYNKTKFFKIVQVRRKFIFNTFPNRSQIRSRILMLMTLVKIVEQ